MRRGTSKLAMTSSCSFTDALNFLKWLETHWELEAPVKEKIQTLRLKASFLKAFFSCTGKWHIDDKNLEFLLRHIHVVVHDATQNFMLTKSKCWSSQEKLYSIISSVLEKVDIVKPDIQQVYTLLSKSTRSTSSTTDAVEKFIDVLLENLKDLLRWKAHLFSPLRKEVEGIEENLRFLRDFLWYMKKCCTEQEKVKDLQIRAEAVADNMACLLYLCTGDINMDEDLLNGIQFELSCQLQKIKPVQPDIRDMYIKALKASKPSQQSIFLVDELVLRFLDSLVSSMIELTNFKEGFLICMMDQIEALHEELKILRDYLMDPSAQHYIKNRPNVNNLLLHINDVVCDASCVIYSSYDNDITEDMARRLSLEISDLLQEFKIIKEEARDIYDEIIAKSLRSNFPKVHELGFINFVVDNLKELIYFKADSLSIFQHQIETVHGNISSLIQDFVEITEQLGEQEELKDPLKRFKDIVYQIEYVVDSMIIMNHNLWVHKLGLFDVMEEIKIIRKEVNNVKDKKVIGSPVLQFSTTLGGVSSLADSGKIDALSGFNHDARNEAKKPIDYVELFDDEAKMITEQLTSGFMKLHILTIVGMAGIGKTTLANSIYENPMVPLYFHVHARCCVTHAYQKRRLLLEILQQVSRETYQECKMSDDDLTQILYRNLKGKKYFIFFDDLWDIRPWNDMKAAFPDDSTGSRIMFTSQFHNIALETESESITYPLNPISDLKSWELLQVKLFEKENCPQELSKVGQKIAANCKGLTIAVDLIAGLLRTKGREKECWEQVANSLNAHLLEDQQERCMSILELSYNQLPNHLKPCFLSFGSFPEDEEVPTSKLLWLWIAEGFVQPQNDDTGSLEGAAENYLNDLIARSLIIGGKRGSFGGVKASGVHDLLHNFALAKAKDECFLNQTIFCADHLSSCDHSVYEAYRLSIHSTWEQFAASKPFRSRVRSMVFSGSSKQRWYGQYPTWPVFESFKLLKVLDISRINIDYSPSIFGLVHLRFLSLKNDSKQIPQEIGNLQNLQTFILKTSRKIKLPKTFWNLVRLRNFRIEGGTYALPGYSQVFLEKSFKFDNLQSLSTPSLCYGEETEEIMRCLPNLRKLSCIFLSSWDHSSSCNRFPILDFLTRLESLKVVYGGEVLRSPCEFNFPPNLKKLTLSNFRLPWAEISTIGKLPGLEVLKLLSGAFDGKTWDMTEGEFVKLKFLKFHSLYIAEWNTSEDHLPKLETLVLENCSALEIPPSLGDIQTLKRLELRGCSHLTLNSSRIIKEKQEEMGNEQFVLTI